MPTTLPANAPESPQQPRHSTLLTDVAIGMNDGLTIPFALATGLAGAAVSNHIIVVACLAATAAGSIIMGVGGYMAGKAAQAHYNKELQQGETEDFFANIGMPAELQEQATEDIVQDKDRWAAFMNEYELAPATPNRKQARNSALNISLSYIVGGLVPLAPYFFITPPIDALKISAPITLVCLFVFGYFKSKVIGMPAWGGALLAMLVGAVAAACAFGVGRMI